MAESNESTSPLDDLASAASSPSQRRRPPRHTSRIGRKQNPDALLAVASFLIPLAGFIMGAIFLSRDHPTDRATGRVCLTAAIVAIAAGFLLWLLLAGLMCTTMAGPVSIEPDPTW
jgi:hypothetical protein